MKNRVVRLRDVASLNISNRRQNEKKIAYLDTGNIIENRVIKIQYFDYLDNIPSSAKRKVKEEDNIFSMVRTNQKHFGYINRSMENLIVSTGFSVVTPNKNKINSRYLFYLLTNNEVINIFQKLAEGCVSTYPTLSLRDLLDFEFKLPSLEEQKRIADILTALDDKIELNNQMNQTLEEIASLLYKRWFVDFEFPDDKGNPYKSSGGEMVDSELGMIPKGWEVKELGSFFDVITGKKNANVSEKNGRYRFFTCSRNFTYSDQFEFDTGAIILAGNGDFNVKWYRGKFDAYQRTYVLSPHNQILLDVLFWIIRERLFEITVASKGSVIKFITKGMIENFKIIFPKKSYSKFVIIFSCLNKINEQNTQNNELVENLKLEILKELC